MSQPGQTFDPRGPMVAREAFRFRSASYRAGDTVLLDDVEEIDCWNLYYAGRIKNAPVFDTTETETLTAPPPRARMINTTDPAALLDAIKSQPDSMTPPRKTFHKKRR